MSRQSTRTNKGMHSHRDEYTVYYDPGNKRAFEDSANGSTNLDGAATETASKKLRKIDDVQESENLVVADEEGDVKCTPCGTTQANYNEETDDKGTMIECELCKTWQHAICMGFKTKKSIPKTYLCNMCDEKTAQRVAELHAVDQESNTKTNGLLNISKSNSNINIKSNSNVSNVSNKDKNHEIDDKIIKQDIDDTVGNGSEKSATSTVAKEEDKEEKKLIPPITSIEQHLKDKVRVSVAKAFFNIFKRHFPDDYTFPEDSNAEYESVKFSLQLEHEILEFANPKDKRYTDKSRSLFVLVKKPMVMSRIMAGTLQFKDIVNLSPEEIDEDLKKYAEKVRQELIRRSVLTVEDELQQRVRRTHKGEEVVENNSNTGDLYSEISIETRSVDHRRFNMDDKQNEYIIPTQNSNVHNFDNVDDDDDNEDDIRNDKGTSNDDSSTSNTGDDIPALDDDDDEELDFILRDKEPSKPSLVPKELQVQSKNDSKSKVSIKSSGDNIGGSSKLSADLWQGEIVFPDFVSFSAQISFVACSNRIADTNLASGISLFNRQVQTSKEILGLKKYEIEGRLDRKKAEDYLRQTLVSRDLYVVKVSGSGYDYDKLFGYLRDHRKVGVLSGKPVFVKDSYLLALDGNNSPDFLAGLKLAEASIYGIFVVKKDYTPPTKSILKKSSGTHLPSYSDRNSSSGGNFGGASRNESHYEPKRTPASIPAKPLVNNNLNSILSKLQ